MPRRAWSAPCEHLSAGRAARLPDLSHVGGCSVPWAEARALGPRCALRWQPTLRLEAQALHSADFRVGACDGWCQADAREAARHQAVLQAMEARRLQGLEQEHQARDSKI